MNIKLMTKEELAVRLEDFCDLFRQCFTTDINEDIVRHRYLENPYSDLLMLVGEDKGKIIANYAAVPTKIIIDGTKYKAALALNAMTHPEYEGNGLFVKLARNFFQHMQEEEYAFVYGFPNQLTNGIYTRILDWKDVYEIPTLELMVDKIGMNNLRDLSEKVESLDCWDGLEHVTERKVEIYKENCYLKWRYQEHPTNHYHVVKFSYRCWAVYHIYQDEVNITEMHHGENETDIRMILDYMIDFAVRNHLKKVTTWSPVNTEEHAILEFYGFRNQSPIRYFGLKVLNYDGKTDLSDHRNWKVHMGDDNVY